MHGNSHATFYFIGILLLVPAASFPWNYSSEANSNFLIAVTNVFSSSTTWLSITIPIAVLYLLSYIICVLTHCIKLFKCLLWIVALIMTHGLWLKSWPDVSSTCSPNTIYSFLLKWANDFKLQPTSSKLKIQHTIREKNLDIPSDFSPKFCSILNSEWFSVAEFIKFKYLPDIALNHVEFSNFYH